MKSIDRILTTHVGSLPRPQPVVDQLFAQDRGQQFDPIVFASTMQAAVLEVVRQQRESGVDIVSDGEMSKISYATYIRHRLNGFAIGEVPRTVPKDLADYPDYRDLLAARGGTPKYHRPVCIGPISVKDLMALHADLDRLRAAMAAHGAPHGFMNAVAPGTIAVFQPNQFYPTHEAYVHALAEAMRPEYEAIVAAGVELQIDAPDLAMGRHIRFRDASDDEFVRNARIQVEALNDALRNVPAERVRLHLCWGNYEGPHHHDVPLEQIIDVVLAAKAASISFEASNPRHAHEWEVWQGARIPADKILIPGVIDSVTNFIEHPRLVAQRLLRFADIVGRERVVAGADCGFGTFAGFGAIHPPIAYAKLRAMAEGARIASEALWR
jgi:5-methyltetrahydropteroyltriglutamate--homocysteine methyltransferase